MSVCRRLLQWCAICQFTVVLSTFAVISMPISFVQAQAPLCQNLFISDEVIILRLKILAELQFKIMAGEYKDKPEARELAEQSFREQVSGVVKNIGFDRFKGLYAQAQKTVQKSEIQQKQEKRNEKEAKINTLKLHLDNLLKIKTDDFFSDNVINYFEQISADYRPAVSEFVLTEWRKSPDKSIKREFYKEYLQALSDLVHYNQKTPFEKLKKSFDLKMYGASMNQALLMAFLYHNKNAFEYILQLPDVDLGWVYRDEYTAWHQATFRNWIESIELLIQLSPHNINNKDYLGLTALQLAISKGHKKVFHLLIQQPQVDLHANQYNKKSVLYWTVQHGWKDSFDFIVNQRGVVLDPEVVELAKSKGWM